MRHTLGGRSRLVESSCGMALNQSPDRRPAQLPRTAPGAARAARPRRRAPPGLPDRVVDRPGRLAPRFRRADQRAGLRRRARRHGAGPPRGRTRRSGTSGTPRGPRPRPATPIEADARLVARVEGLDEETRRTARFPSWVGEVDLAGFATARLMEHAVHTWDIAVALDPAATVADDAVPVVLAGIRGLVRYAAKPEGRTGRVLISTEVGDYLLSYGESGAGLDPVTGPTTRIGRRRPRRCRPRRWSGWCTGGSTRRTAPGADSRGNPGRAAGRVPRLSSRPGCRAHRQDLTRAS